MDTRLDKGQKRVVNDRDELMRFLGEEKYAYDCQYAYDESGHRFENVTDIEFPTIAYVVPDFNGRDECTAINVVLFPKSMFE